MYRYRVCFAKRGDLKYISHLDLQRTVARAVYRAELPVAYSQGFSPQPRLIFAAPLAVGIEGEKEWLELDLTEPLPPRLLQDRLQAQLPPGLELHTVEKGDPQEPSLASRVTAALYRVDLSEVPQGLESRIQELLSRDELVVNRPGKKGEKKVDIKPFIFKLYLDNIKEPGANTEGGGTLIMHLATGNRGGARPTEVLQLLRFDNKESPPLIHRTALLETRGDKQIVLS